MPEDKEKKEDSKEPKKGVLKELKKGNKRSMLGIAVALAGIIVAWFLYQRSQAQQASAAGSTFMPYTPGATAGTGTPLSTDVASQLFQQQGQFQTSMDLGFSGLQDSLAGLSTKFDDLNSSLSSHETPGGTVTPSPHPTPAPAKKRYVMQSGHPVDYAYLAAGRHPIIRDA